MPPVAATLVPLEGRAGLGVTYSTTVLPAANFAVETMLVPDLKAMDSQRLIGDTIRTRQRLARAARTRWAARR